MICQSVKRGFTRYQFELDDNEWELRTTRSTEIVKMRCLIWMLTVCVRASEIGCHRRSEAQKPCLPGIFLAPVKGGAGSNWMIRPTWPSRVSTVRAAASSTIITNWSALLTLGKAVAVGSRARRAVATNILKCIVKSGRKQSC